MKDVTKAIFAERVKELRLLNNLQQKDVGDMTGIAPNAISNWELVISAPSVSALRKLCLGTGWSADHLLGLDHPDMTAQDYQCWRKFHSVSPEVQKTVMDLLDHLPTAEE